MCFCFPLSQMCTAGCFFSVHVDILPGEESSRYPEFEPVLSGLSAFPVPNGIIPNLPRTVFSLPPHPNKVRPADPSGSECLTVTVS